VTPAWPKFHHDIQNVGRGEQASVIYVGSRDGFLYALNPGGTLRWAYNLAGDPWTSSPAIGPDGTIYIGATFRLRAVNPDGTIKWSSPALPSTVDIGPTVGSDGAIYFAVAGPGNRVYCYNPDGTQRWVFVLGGGNVGYGCLVHQSTGRVYLGDNTGRIYCLNPDGTLNWSFLTGGNVRSCPSLSKDQSTVYVGSLDGILRAFTLGGTPLWAFNPGTPGSNFTSSPMVGPDGTIYEGNADNNLYAVNPDGTQLWAYNIAAPQQILSTPALLPDGGIVFGSQDDKLYCLNPGDGSERWRYVLFGGDVESSPAVAPDGSIYVGSDDALIRCFNPDGTLRWTYVTGNEVLSSPAII